MFSHFDVNLIQNNKQKPWNSVHVLWWCSLYVIFIALSVKQGYWIVPQCYTYMYIACLVNPYSANVRNMMSS